tara:strand:+ start:85 stop:915 length:831 start_codon:yes stop_codon:yes gene_type:complete
MLNRRQLEEYKNDGFTIYKNFLNKLIIKNIINEVNSVITSKKISQESIMEMEPDENKAVRRLYEPCSNYPICKEVSESKIVLDCVEQLIGKNIIFHYSKLNMKPPRVGSVVEWHQDLTYYPLTNNDSLTFLIYLDNASSENGCLKIIKKSHISGIKNHDKNDIFQGRVMEKVDEHNVEYIEASAGTAIFMHCMSLHSSAQNISQKSRRTLIMSYRAVDAYPIYSKMTEKTESSARLVRGKHSNVARFNFESFPIPRFKEEIKSLYELQKDSRENRI